MVKVSIFLDPLQQSFQTLHFILDLQGIWELT